MTETVSTTATATVEAKSGPPKSFDDLDDLVVAAAAAGLSCNVVDETTLLNMAATTGCEGGHFMGVWESGNAMATDLTLLAVALQTLAVDDDDDLLVRLGPDWVIFRHQPSDDPEVLGGVSLVYLATGDPAEMAAAFAAISDETDTEESDLEDPEPQAAPEAQDEEPGPSAEVSDGVWSVGRDIEPGTYRPMQPVGDDCYWAVTTSGSNGSDIVDNGIPGGGFPTVTVSQGQDLELSRCGVWELQ